LGVKQNVKGSAFPAVPLDLEKEVRVILPRLSPPSPNTGLFSGWIRPERVGLRLVREKGLLRNLSRNLNTLARLFLQCCSRICDGKMMQNCAALGQKRKPATSEKREIILEQE
jgi:hypothetical protein